MHKNKLLFVISFLLLFISACGETIALLPGNQELLDDVPDFLINLEQINDYPFYVAYYDGDYGFDAYLESGVYPATYQEIIPLESFACSCFYASGDNPIFGRNFDWYEHPALLLFTDPPGGYKSVSMVDISYLGYDSEFTPIDDPDGLRSAPFYPFDGMNEYGLVVGMMAIGHAEGEINPSYLTLDSLELMRLVLDHARDVPEALALLEGYNVDFGSVPVHYLISDHEGNSVVIEYLNNEIVVVESKEPFQVATNFILSEVLPEGANSHSYRYNTLVRTLSKLNGLVSTEFAMDLLEDVSQSGGEAETRWSVVYDLGTKSLSIAINRNFGAIYQFSID